MNSIGISMGCIRRTRQHVVGVVLGCSSSSKGSAGACSSKTLHVPAQTDLKTAAGKVLHPTKLGDADVLSEAAIATVHLWWDG
jgi:hypothetical protein